MDILAQEIAGLKRKAVDDTAGSATTSSNSAATGPQRKKYLTKGELEKIRLAEEAEKDRKRKEESKAKKEAAELARKNAFSKSRLGGSKPQTPDPASGSNTPVPSGSQSPSTVDATSTNTSRPEAFNISPVECVRRLRAKGQPIRLFGESDKDRRLRLRALELMDERGGSGANAGLNDFKKALEEMQAGSHEKEEMKKANKASGGNGSTGVDAPSGEGMGMGEGGVLDLSLIKTDPDKLYPLIYYALKRTLKDWEQTMADRPESIRQSTQGMRAAAVQVQSADYLKPLFKSLRSRDLPADVLGRLSEIVHHMQSRQYQRANDSYLRLSIGTAAWPIGVTMVGIHERSAREKISSDSVAHVLNDEVSRKYIQSVKRLLTFAQTKYPPADVSQMMG
ncbi:U5 snRNP-associated RNA splicing factor [Phaffia rhodozyma]|uniref:Pre-mRNA-splicing factor 18 n=1 Tax=Phaffia rhodozyma TaxID=264483 RepID=A0A0F7SKS8_PHARH|nr:U5 snRNP-associated RNA splicing factor [Phaffia rhodozyma]